MLKFMMNCPVFFGKMEIDIILTLFSRSEEWVAHEVPRGEPKFPIFE